MYKWVAFVFVVLFAAFSLLAQGQTPGWPAASPQAQEGEKAPAIVIPAVKGLENLQVYKLNNGLKVALVPVKDAKHVDVYVLYLAGTRNETDATSGLAHLTEHTMYTGSRNVQPGDHDKQIHDAGGSPNAFTRTDYTVYFDWKMPVDKLELALKLEADRMGWPRFDAAAFQKEKENLLKEEKGNTDGASILSGRLKALAYERHPYRVGGIGGPSTNAVNLTLEDCREFNKKYYTPNNAVLVIVGEFDGQKTRELVEKYFGEVPKGVDAPSVTVVEPPQWGWRRSACLIETLDKSQAVFAFHIPNYQQKDTYTLRILAQIVSERWQKLLPRGVQGLAKKVNVYAELNHDPGLWIFTGYVSHLDQSANTENFLANIIGEIQKTGVSKAELARAINAEAKLFADKELLVRPYFSLAEDLGKFILFGDEKYVQEYGKRVSTVTEKAVQEAAQKYFLAENLTALVAAAPPPSAKPQQDARPKLNLGISVEQGPEGMQIKSIAPGSAAEKAGLKLGDQIVKILDFPVKKEGDYDQVMVFLKDGVKQFTIIRDGKTEVIPVTLSYVRSGITPRKVWIGFNLEEKPAQDGGLVIREITPGGPAEKAGLKVGDILLKAAGMECEEYRPFVTEIMPKLSPGKNIFTIRRDGKESEVEIELIEFSKSPVANVVKAEKLGMSFSKEAAKNGGLPIFSIDKGGRAEKAGLQKGDIVVKIEDFKIGTFDDFMKAANSIKVGVVNFVVVRDGKEVTIKVE